MHIVGEAVEGCQGCVSQRRITAGSVETLPRLAPKTGARTWATRLEHPAVRDCGVIGKKDAAAGEIPVAFIVLRDGFVAGSKMEQELGSFVADRLTSYKQPREVRFVESVPKTLSGKILGRELRKALEVGTLN